MWRCGLLGDVIMYQRHAIVADKGRAPGHQLVQCGAETVIVAAVVDIAVDTSALLRGDIGKAAVTEFRCVPAGLLAAEASAERKADQLDQAGVGVEQQVIRVHLLMNNACFVQLSQQGTNADRH